MTKSIRTHKVTQVAVLSESEVMELCTRDRLLLIWNVYIRSDF